MSDWHFRVRRSFLRADDVSPQAKYVRLLVESYAGKSGEAWPTKPQLCHASGMSEHTLDRYLDELRASGHLAWVLYRDEAGRSRRKYTITTTPQDLPCGRGAELAPQTVTIKQQGLKKRSSTLRVGIGDPHEPP